MNDLAARKAAAREAAFARRKEAFGSVDQGAAQAALTQVLDRFAGRVVSGFLPIRTEIDPRPAMARAARTGPVCVPVIEGRGVPLKFREWTPGCRLHPGPFGAEVPVEGRWLVPEVLIVPLAAFDRSGNRLGYGGGYFDRTLEQLRKTGAPVAIGFAFAAQEAEAVPCDGTDQRLDAVVTEAGTIPMPGGRPLAP